MKKPSIVKQCLALSKSVILIPGLLLALVGSTMAQENRVAPSSNPPAAPSQVQGPTDPAELEAFLDDLFGKQMKEHHIAGAAVSVVKDGELFFAKGYGYADLENGLPVDPEQTIFRIGSLGKTFTWTAVMQLVEQGKLDLDADVNTYLDFRIPDTYPGPITLKHLMAHTSGFEERWLESVVSHESELIPAREWLISNMAKRVRPPGDCAGYSNYNAMLAGYIVARASGLSYDQYIQKHILDPLGMAHSTAQSPMPPELRAYASGGYTYEDGAFQAFPDYMGQPALLPSGSVQASAADMARFMIMHLQGGFYGDASTEIRILEEATARQMQSTLYTPDPRLLGMAYGFADLSDNGQRTLGHQGYSPPMQSLLLLLPDQNLGVFVVSNSRDVGELTTQHVGFQRAFFDHYYPAPEVEPIQPPAHFEERAPRFAGLYRLASYPASTPDKVADLFGAFTVKVSDPGDGTLLVPINGAELRVVEVEPLYFRQVDGPFAIVFREDDRGRITHMSTDLMPQYAATRTPWYELASFNLPLVMVSVLLITSILIVAPVQAIIGRRRGGGAGPASRTARWNLVLISLLNIAFLVGMFLGYHPPTELHGVAPFIKFLMGLTVLSALLTAAALVYAALAWKDRYWGIASRLYYTLVTVAAVAFVWFLNQWNLLGWRF